MQNYGESGGTIKHFFGRAAAHLDEPPLLVTVFFCLKANYCITNPGTSGEASTPDYHVNRIDSGRLVVSRYFIL